MSQYAKFFLQGRVTNDPTRYVDNSGRVVTHFGLAINQYYRTPNGEPREEATFLNINARGRTAEIAITHLKRGYLVGLEGRISNRTYTEKETGKKRTVVEGTATYIHLMPAAIQPSQQRQTDEEIRDTDLETSRQEGIIQEDPVELPPGTEVVETQETQVATAAQAAQPAGPGANPAPTAT